MLSTKKINLETTDLFGSKVQISSSIPLNVFERQALQKERIEQRIEAGKKHWVFTKEISHGQFESSHVHSCFVGQNVYIRPNYVVSIPEYYFFNSNTGELVETNPRVLTDAFQKNKENLKDNSTRGKLSKKAIQNLKNSINWLCISAKRKSVFNKSKGTRFNFKVNFVTLTLPDTKKPITSAEFQKNLLNPFLTYMRQYKNLKNYVWRLEFQANGKLHCHLTTDTFLHLKDIRREWNGLLKKSGYLDLFFDKNGHWDPNSTDVHATRKIKNMAAYLAKYMSKKNSSYSNYKEGKPLGAMDAKAWYIQRVNFWNSPLNPRPISGRIWGCSLELSKANKTMVHIPSENCANSLSCLMDSDIQYRSIKSKDQTVSTPYGDFSKEGKKIGEVFFLKFDDWCNRVEGVIKEKFFQVRGLLASMNETLNFEV